MRVISQKLEIKSFTHKIKARVTFYFPKNKIKIKGKRHTLYISIEQDLRYSQELRCPRPRNYEELERACMSLQQSSAMLKMLKNAQLWSSNARLYS